MQREITLQKRWNWLNYSRVDWHLERCTAPSVILASSILRTEEIAHHLETPAARRLARKRLRKIKCPECKKTLLYKAAWAYLMQPKHVFEADEKEQLDEVVNEVPGTSTTNE